MRVLYHRYYLAIRGKLYREVIAFCVIPAQAGIQYTSFVNTYYVYILASKRNGTLYIGVTNDLARRMSEHKSKEVAGFTKKYNVGVLVYYETTNDINSAIAREKCLKKWERAWKIRLIEEDNPMWHDLSLDF